MADSANTFTGLQPMFKEAYANKAMATHLRPGKELFKAIKDRLKKKKK